MSGGKGVMLHGFGPMPLHACKENLQVVGSIDRVCATFDHCKEKTCISSLSTCNIAQSSPQSARVEMVFCRVEKINIFIAHLCNQLNHILEVSKAHSFIIALILPKPTKLASSIDDVLPKYFGERYKFSDNDYRDVFVVGKNRQAKL